MTEASYTKAVCPVCETIVDVGDFMAWGAGRCPGCGWQWWWDCGLENPVIDWAQTSISMSKVTEECIQAMRTESEGKTHREGSSADYAEHTKPRAMPCARCPSHFFDPDPKAKAPCAVKIQELKAELERRKSFREKWVVKAIKDGGNDIELVECCNCARVEATLEALRNLEYTTIENEEGESVNVVSQLQINTALNREMSDKPLVFHKHHDDDPMFGFDEEEEIDG